MAFVRTKQVGGKTYYQLVKNERVDGRHTQRVLMHLGMHPTVEDALEAWRKRAGWYRDLAATRRERIRSYRATSRALARIGGTPDPHADDNNGKLRKWGRDAEEFDARAANFEEKVERLKCLGGD